MNIALCKILTAQYQHCFTAFIPVLQKHRIRQWMGFNLLTVNHFQVWPRRIFMNNFSLHTLCVEDQDVKSFTETLV